MKVSLFGYLISYGHFGLNETISLFVCEMLINSCTFFCVLCFKIEIYIGGQTEPFCSSARFYFRSPTLQRSIQIQTHSTHLETHTDRSKHRRTLTNLKMLRLILEKIRYAYLKKKDRRDFRQHHATIFGLERKRAKKACWHQVTLTLREFEAQSQRVADEFEPLANDVMRWPPPVYRPGFAAHPEIFVTPPSGTRTIPPHLRRAFPFPFMPERLFDEGECCSNMCPVRGLHLAGLYYRDRTGPYVMDTRTEWFGDSEAPPEVWDAVSRLQAGDRHETLDQDVATVRDFRRCHYYTFQEQGEMKYKEVVRYASACYKAALEVCKKQKRGDYRAGAGAGAGATITVGYALGALAGAGANLAATGISSATAAGAASATVADDDADTVVDADADADADTFVDADTIVDVDADTIVDADADTIVDTIVDAFADAGADAVEDALLALASAAADLADLGVASTIEVGAADAPTAGGDDAAGVAVADAASVDADPIAEEDIFFDADSFIAVGVAADGTAGGAADGVAVGVATDGAAGGAAADGVAADGAADGAADDLSPYITVSPLTSAAPTPIEPVSYEAWILDFD